MENPPSQSDPQDIAPGDTQAAPTPSRSNKPKTRPHWFRWALFGLLALLLTAAISAFGGYQNGIRLRQAAEATMVASQLDEQYNLALQNMQAKQYDLARQRLEYIINHEPGYPGASEKLAIALMELNTTATPTPRPTSTPIPSPTVDANAVDNEKIFQQAQQSMLNSDWNAAIDTLLILRRNAPDLHTVEVDDMLFMALRNRGWSKITNADLEGGIYDLTLAEKFGYLDTEAKGLLNWAQIYITGASFWELDWQKAVYYFSQVEPMLPSMRDGSGMTSRERLRQALYNYGDQLAAAGECDAAREQYEASLNLGTDPKVDERISNLADSCSPKEGGDQPPSDNQPVTTPTP